MHATKAALCSTNTCGGATSIRFCGQGSLIHERCFQCIRVLLLYSQQTEAPTRSSNRWLALQLKAMTLAPLLPLFFFALLVVSRAFP